MALSKKRLQELLDACTPNPDEEREVEVNKSVKEPTAKEFGELADLTYTTRQERLAKKKEVDEIEELEKGLKRVLIGFMPKGKGVSGVAGNICRASTKNKQIAKIADFNKLTAWIKKTNAFDVFQRRLNDKAIDERIADGKKVPGVEFIEILTVSLEKV